MTILSRLHKGINAGWGTINGVIGIPLDLARGAIMDDDEYDGVLSTIYNTTVNRGGQILENTLGKDGIGATIIAPIPAGARNAAWDLTLGAVFEASENLGRDLIRQPISTALTVGSLASAPGGGGIAGLVRPSNWSEGSKIAQGRSWGQSLALMGGTKDITNQVELTAAMNSDAYGIASGTADGLGRIFLEPDFLAGKLVKGVRAARNTITPENITSLMNDKRVVKFAKNLWDITNDGPRSGSAARIRSRFYPDHPQGAQIANILGDAETPEAQFWAMRALMKDPEAIARLDDIQSATQPLIARATARLEDLTIMKDQAKFPHPDWADDIAQASAEVEQLYGFSNRAGTILEASGAIKQVPKVTRSGAIRESIVRSNYYSQRNTFSKPLHAVFDMNPQRLINASDHTGDTHLDRMLGVADIPRPLRDEYRSRYMAANTPDARQEVLLQAQEESIGQLAARAGMTEPEIMEVLSNLAAQRGHTLDAISKRVFDKRGNSKFDVMDENGEAIRHHLPATMTSDALLVPIVDMNAVKKATTRIGQLRSHNPAMSIPGLALESVYRVWKPSMLLRVGWPIKIIMDEQLRIMAKIGALSQLDNLYTGLTNYTTDYIAKARELGQGSRLGIASGIREVRGFKSKELRSEFGLRELEHNGYKFESARGIPGDMKKHVAEQASAGDTFKKMGGDRELPILNSLREYGAHIKSVDPDNVDYPTTYNWAASHLPKDPIAKMLLKTDSVDEVVTLLRSTVEGSEILRKSSIKAHDVRNWVTEINDQIDHYTGSNPLLREQLAKGELTHDSMKAILGDDVSLHPPAHAEVLMQATGDSYIHKQLTNFVEGAYRRLGSTPPDILSRNRYLDHVYQAEVKRQIDILDENGPISDAHIKRIEESSRVYALGETKNLLYDLAESSQLARMLKFLSPFYSAWQEVITRWAGLAVENPAFIARMHQIWQAPEKAGILTDENGREITWGEVYTKDTDTDTDRGSDRYINVPAEWAYGIPFVRDALDSKGNIRLNRKGLNMVMAGGPGAGPVVQIPVNEILKHRPDLESSVKFVSPFGAQYGLLQQVLPTTAKLLVSEMDEDRAWATSVMRIHTDKQTTWKIKHKSDPLAAGPQPTFEDALSEAAAFYNLRRVASYVSPIALGYTSPYQLQIDAFRQAQRKYANDKTKMALADKEGNIRTPDEWFLDEYGPEYFELTRAVTQTMNGIPPTLEAWKASKKVKDLIAANPEYGGLILGDTSGEFHSGVYNSQLNTRLSATSNKNQREVLSFEESIADPQRRLGWIEYRRFVDGIEAARIAEGLPNLQVKKARGLQEMKSLFTEELKERNPAWAEDFNQTDKGKWDKRIEVFTSLASNPQLLGRRDIQLLAEYLDSRDFMNVELEARGKKKGGAKTLTSSTNADLKDLWDIITGSLIEQDLGFSNLYYRYLENDPLGL